jgi:hypothetical protein
VEEERRVVVFKMGTREQALTIDETKPIPSYLVERNLPVRGLSSQMKRAVREGRGEVRVTEDSRLDLLEVLDAMERLGQPQTEGQSASRAALREPILLT